MVVRWLARHALESQPALDQLQLALSALAILRWQGEPAMTVLGQLSR